ncbi:ATP-binding cassette domain-containing protein [Epidermidibacterium keratini]|uniref:ATP-binding cassette domain-containing protein n=1 Tax=Epidermidibacterium keratini TaxID=1891644 RepID=A0A7L4YRE1_9ACTN|nr:ABC-F family ATP-binding cassette domain-containing protein [Epidermidibacterium keratini]QHC01716.1 ATP-binding cassette domain-containing protein [Epidermidibacterium keratini]
MANQVNLDSVTVQFDVTPVLDRVSAGIDDRDRIGVVGLNGAGKSTLLDVVARRRTPDSGRVSWRSGLQVAEVGQSDDFGDTTTVREIVLPGSADAEHTWAADPRVRRVVEGLGLHGLGLETPAGSLSGGERRRVGLAAALVADVDLLILDEPTNHLDIEGVRWLADYLREYAGALLVVTHDRWFLDNVTTRTWEVVGAAIHMYDGGYADWVFARAERARIADATEERRRNLARKELAWLRRGAPARTSKPRFRIEAANALIADVPPPRDKVELVATATSRMGKTVVDLEDVTVRLGERDILQHVTWRLSPGGRYGVLGPNGAGKSTLLRTILGEQPIASGHRTIGSTVRAAHLSQNLAELDPGQRMIEAVSEHATLIRIGDKDLTGGQLLERFGFPARMHKQFVRDLSGGQRRRLQLVRTLMGEPNLLVLDEPTNDLDVDTLTALEDLLDGWSGTLLVVSHDRYLLERVTDEQYAVLGDGRLRHLPGGVDEYLRLVAGRDRSALRGANDVSAAGPSADAGSTAAAASAATPAASAAERREARKAVGRIERQLAALETREQKLHDQLAEHASDFEKVREFNAALTELTAQRAELEEQWLEAADLAD